MNSSIQLKYYFSCLIIFLLSAQLALAGNFEVISPYPQWWGEFSQAVNGISGCPKLSGKFQREGDSYEYQNSNPTASSQQGNLRLIINSLLSFGKKPSQADSSEHVGSDEFLMLLQEGRLLVSIPRNNHLDVLDQYKFESQSNDFECKNGWLIFPPQSETVAGESHHIIFFERLAVRTLEDGSLLVYKKQDIKNASIWNWGAGNTIVNEKFARFLSSK